MSFSIALNPKTWPSWIQTAWEEWGTATGRYGSRGKQRQSRDEKVLKVWRFTQKQNSNKKQWSLPLSEMEPVSFCRVYAVWKAASPCMVAVVPGWQLKLLPGCRGLSQSLGAVAQGGGALICMSSPPPGQLSKSWQLSSALANKCLKKLISPSKENTVSKLSPMHLKYVAVLSFKLL